MQMKAYNSYGLAIYCTVGCLKDSSIARLEAELDFFTSHLGLTKVYIETHRGQSTLTSDKIGELKAWFQSRGIQTSGGITTTLNDHGMNHPRFLGVICYSNPENRKRLQDIVELTASHFDEVILDDFFFTNCKCPDCIEAKGARTWQEYRLELMTSVSADTVCTPARSVNPNVALTIKYPNWKESFAATGYNTETQPIIFDDVYTGTETRYNEYTQQNIPRYGSYSLMRWFENLKPTHNKGGWFDNLDCATIDSYVEQGVMTALSKPKEITLFCWSSLASSQFIQPLGHHLRRLDTTVRALGSPVGITLYDPRHASGEDHIHDYLGMVGIPFEPKPDMVSGESPSTVMLTQSSAADPEVTDKLKEHLMRGGTAVVTSGFICALDPSRAGEFTSLRVSGRRASISRYAMGTSICSFSDYDSGSESITIPIIEYRTNDTWPHIVGLAADYNTPVFLQDNYGPGRLYTLAVPDSMADIAKMPMKVLDYLRSTICSDLPLYLRGPAGASLFIYDNNTFAISSSLLHSERWCVTLKSGGRLFDAMSEREIKAIDRNAASASVTYEVHLAASSYSIFKFE